jgi:hypothetical protein
MIWKTFKKYYPDKSEDECNRLIQNLNNLKSDLDNIDTYLKDEIIENYNNNNIISSSDGKLIRVKVPKGTTSKDIFLS